MEVMRRDFRFSKFPRGCSKVLRKLCRSPSFFPAAATIFPKNLSAFLDIRREMTYIYIVINHL